MIILNTKKTFIKSACAVALLSASLGTIATTVHATETGQAKIENTNPSTSVDKKNQPINIFKEKRYSVAEEIVDIKTQSDLDNIVKEKGSELTGANLRFQNTENLVFPAGVSKFAGNTKMGFPSKHQKVILIFQKQYLH